MDEKIKEDKKGIRIDQKDFRLFFETMKRTYVPTTIPPSTRRTVPEIKLASSVAKKR